MKAKQIALLFLGVYGLVVLLVWLITPNGSEPDYKYNGKHYTEWLEQFIENSQNTPPNLQKVNEARDAIQQIGTNAVPTLITLISHADSVPKQVVGTMLHLISGQGLEWNKPEVKQEMVLLGFSALRSEPGPAVPALIQLLSHEHIEVRVQAASALAAIGPQAQPAVSALIDGLRENGAQDPRVTIASIRALSEIRANAETVVPFLVDYVASSDCWQVSVSAICHFGEQAAFVAPQLRKIAETTNDESLKAEIHSTMQKISEDPSESLQPSAGLPSKDSQ